MYSLDTLKKTIKYPTSLIVGGIDSVGIELAKALLEQGGFVIMIDNVDDGFLEVISELTEFDLFCYFDYSFLLRFEDYLRRLDYVFYLSHNINNLDSEISSQDFLEFSKFLDQVLNLAVKYNSKFLGSTSITAHQTLIDTKVHAIELGEVDRIHTVYTQAEIQRYTESLTLEYHAKSQLNARIVRLGNVIGADSYTPTDSKLGNLISDALFEDEIRVLGDGLDSDYYVDLQDAVYGLIKAQFSKDTDGEIFSVAYENEISVLSIVYKLNELIEHPKEIVFSEGNTNSKLFRLYKPAPNLMRIGWAPRVNFERSLKQTIEEFSTRRERELDQSMDIYEATAESTNGVTTDNKIGFFSWLFFKQDRPANVQSPAEGALSHLIEERKKASEMRRGSILMANSHRNANDTKKLRPAGTRVRGNIMRNFDKLLSHFDSLRYITIKQFVIVVILSVVLLLLYFNVFVVLVDAIKQVLVINKSDNEISQQLKENNNYSQDYSKQYENISLAIDSINNDLGVYPLMDNISGYAEIKTKTGQTSNAVRQIYAGSRDLDYVLQNTKDFLEAYNENVVYKQYSQSILGIDNEQLVIKQFDDYSPSYSISTDAINTFARGLAELEDIDTTKMNLYLKNFWDRFVVNTGKVGSIYTNLSKIDKFVPALVGESGQRAYVVILLDNTLYTPAGGLPVSELLVVYNKGKLEDIQLLNTINDSRFDVGDDELIQAELSTSLPADSINSQYVYSDIFNSDQGNFYLEGIKEYYIDEDRVASIDGVITINLNTLGDIINIQDPIEVEGKVFTKENLIDNINQLTIQNENDIEFRKELISNIFALAVQNFFNSLGSNVFELAGIIENNINRKDINYLFNDDLFDGYLNINNSTDDVVQNLQDYIAVSSYLDRENYQYENGIFNLKLEVDVSISDIGDIRKTIEIENEAEQSVTGILLCLPSIASNFEFLESTAQTTDFKTNQAETCMNLKFGSNNLVKLSYDIPKLPVEGDQWDYTLGIRKQPGTRMDLDIELKSDYGVLLSAEGLEIRDKISAGYNGEVTGDGILSVKLQ